MNWKPTRTDSADDPIYLSLAAQLESDIASGKLPVGTKLPPQRELADFLDINFTTVTRAYELCRTKGLIRGVVGRGTFVAEATRADKCGRELFDCAVVQSFAALGSSFIAQAAQKVLAEGKSEQLFSYEARDGWPHHREAGASWMTRSGIEVKPEQVSVFPGVQSALSTALLTLFRPGDALAVDYHTYANLIQLARLAHVRLVAIEGDEGGMLAEALAEAVKGERKLRGVFLMPTCANPTTITLSERRKEELAEVIRGTELTLLEDNLDLGRPSDKRRTMFARLPEQTVHLSGAIRVIAPGLRVTYVAYPKLLSERLQTGLHHLAIKASALEAEILGELVVSGKAERILELKRRKAMEANAVFDAVFASDGGDSTRMFRTLNCIGTVGRGAEIEAQFAAAGVKVCHSDRFVVRRGDSDSFLRISISSMNNLQRLRKALNVIRDLHEMNYPTK